MRTFVAVMRTLAAGSIVAGTLSAASVIAFAALVGSAHMAATAVNDRDDRMKMAQAPAAEMWYIQAVVALDGKTTHTQFIVPNEEGKPALLTFSSKESCDTSRVDNADIAGTLAKFQEQVDAAGGTVVVSCEKFVHPPTDRPA